MRTLLILVVFLAPQLFAKSMVWQISDGENVLYLAGTMHLLSQDDYPLPKAYKKAYAKADSVYFEADTQMQQSVDYQRQLQQLLFYPKGQSLFEHINAEAGAKLEAYIAQRGLAKATFARMRPSLAGLSITIHSMMELGVSEPGVDEFYLNRARKDKKPIEFFETPLEQLHFLAELGKGYESQFILESIDEVKQLPEVLSAMKKAWRQGDVEKLQALVIDDMREQYPDVYQSLLVTRNKRWLPTINKALATNDVEMILVGSAHLLGEDGLLQSLKQQGFTVQQLP